MVVTLLCGSLRALLCKAVTVTDFKLIYVFRPSPGLNYLRPDTY